MAGSSSDRAIQSMPGFSDLRLSIQHYEESFSCCEVLSSRLLLALYGPRGGFGRQD